MKKAILLIAALLMVGSMAFAEVSIGCWGRTVFNVIGSSSAPNAPLALGWGPNWGGNGLTRMGVTFNFSSKTLSFKLTSYFNGADGDKGDPNDAGNFTLVNMYGACKVIPDMLTVIVGRNGGDGFDDFRKTQPNPNSDMNNNLGRMSGWGLWIVFQPKDLGLEIAANLMTPNPAVIGGTIYGQPVNMFAQGYNWATALHSLNFAASYTIPDILKITAAFMNQCSANYGADTVVIGNNDGMGGGTITESKYEVYGRVDVLAIQGMTLWIDGAYTGFESSNPANLQLDLGFGYKIGDLGLYLAGRAGIPLTAGSPTIAANLEVTYTIKPITVGLVVGSVVPLAANSNMQFEFQPYLSLDDISMRIAFDYQMNTGVGGINYWNVPIYFTFSF